MITAMPRDTKTKFQGVYARHSKHCRVETGGQRCNCSPSYWGKVWDRSQQKMVKTPYLQTVGAARNARNDMLRELQDGNVISTGGLRLLEARERFVTAAREGKALNKRGQRYKPSAIDNIEQSIRKHVEPTLKHKRLRDIRRGDVQAVIDDLAPRLSGSRVRNVVNSLRALYAWAQDRDLAAHDPAQRVRLPAMNATPVDRVATPTEFTRLLEVLDDKDALVYALAAYASARNQQTRRLDWAQVDLDAFAWVELGAEWEAAKYEASHRVVPTVQPLKQLLRRVWLEQGRPATGLVVGPMMRSKTGLVSMAQIQHRADAAWDAAHLERITFQECRHTCATWLDAAGVSPRIASYWMGHAIPRAQLGAAAITLQRYTHTLPDDVARACDQLSTYLTASKWKDQVMSR
jgi:integrase